MKKKISLFLTLIISLVLMGCDKANNQNQTTATNKLNDEEVIEIINKKVPNNKLLQLSYDGDDKVPNYDVTVSDNEYKYDFEINASNGEILKEEKDKVVENNKKSNQVIKIDESKAREIALSQVPNSTIIKYSFDENDSIPNYEITVTDKNHTYEYEINAVDGSIMEKETKNLSND